MAGAAKSHQWAVRRVHCRRGNACRWWWDSHKRRPRNERAELVCVNCRLCLVDAGEDCRARIKQEVA